MDITTFVTSDLPLAAYLVTRGLTLKTATKSINGKFEFVINDPNKIAQSLSVEFVNSDFCKYDHTIRTIKKILYTK